MNEKWLNECGNVEWILGCIKYIVDKRGIFIMCGSINLFCCYIIGFLKDIIEIGKVWK